jgi:glycosyltransferase involved in cell wall biosynthesis
MLGWEFPPYISGGLGTACKGLTEAMKRIQTRVLFVLPRTIDPAGKEDCENAAQDTYVETEAVPSEVVNPYNTKRRRFYFAACKPSLPVAACKPSLPASRADRKPQRSSVRVVGAGAEDGYDGDLLGKVRSYAHRCLQITRQEPFDVVHAHDWITFAAGSAIARRSDKPMVAHVHATEFDRSGGNINRAVYDIERHGMHAASRVIAVSGHTGRIIVQRYGLPPGKVRVVHNGVDWPGGEVVPGREPSACKTVLFLGRITMQKGPEYFVRAAARVAEQVDGVRFVMAGSGDLLPGVRRLVSDLGLVDRVEFTGFLRGGEVDRAYREAGVYVMPSVSEPFGLTALEAVRNGLPVIVSKTSGVAEILRRGSLKVDFWDTELMARMIVSVLRNPALAEMLRREGTAEARGATWDEAARKCVEVYREGARRATNNLRGESR